jgi:hypothetical protein
MRTNGRTDRHYEAQTFRNFANVPKSAKSAAPIEKTVSFIADAFGFPVSYF